MDQAVTQATFDFADARKKMVDGQIRPNRVSDPRILDVMRTLPRERFLPPELAARAYADDPVPLGQGRVMPEPLAIARLVQMALSEPGAQSAARALVIGAGTGYGAALLAACGAQVTALDSEPALIDIARPVLAALMPAVTVVQGPLTEGWSAGAPYDIILIEGAVPEIPAAILAQLRADGGRLVSVLKTGARVGQAVLCASAGGGRVEPTKVFDCAVPVLPMLTRAPGFVF